MTQRVVVTGLGIVSSLGNHADDVTDSLKNGRSGITYSAAQEEIGMRSWVSGKPDIDLSEHIDRKQWRFMGDAAGYAFLSMEQAIADSGLTPDQVSNVRTGIIAGSGGASSASQVEAADILRERGLRRVGPYRVTQTTCGWRSRRNSPERRSIRSASCSEVCRTCPHARTSSVAHPF